MTEFCKIMQQPCDYKDGSAQCGSCQFSGKFLWDIYDTLKPTGVFDYQEKDEGDLLVASYKRKGSDKGEDRTIIMRIRKGKPWSPGDPK